MEQSEARGGGGNAPPQQIDAPRNPPSNYSWLEFWMDLGQLLILGATMVGVFWYACEAKKQSASLHDSVTQQTNAVTEQVAESRPVVLADGVQPLKPLID